MAITDVPEFAHLTDSDIEGLARELDAIRQDIEDSRGARDARYIRRTIALQRALEVAGVDRPDVVAATIGPGLAGALLVGVAAAASAASQTSVHSPSLRSSAAAMSPSLLPKLA